MIEYFKIGQEGEFIFTRLLTAGTLLLQHMVHSILSIRAKIEYRPAAPEICRHRYLFMYDEPGAFSFLKTRRPAKPEISKLPVLQLCIHSVEAIAKCHLPA